MSTIILFKTSKIFQLGETKLDIFENKEKHLYVLVANYYPNGEIANQFVRPLNLADKPYQSDQCHEITINNEKLSLGTQTKDFIIVDMDLQNYLIIENNLPLAIAQLTTEINPLIKKVNKLKARQEVLSKDLAVCENMTKRTKMHVRNIWDIIKTLHTSLREVLSRKKWRKRFSDPDNFFQELQDENVYSDEDLPF